MRLLTIQAAKPYCVYAGSVLTLAGELISQHLNGCKKALLVYDRLIDEDRAACIASSVEAAGIELYSKSVSGGEQNKSLSNVAELCSLMAQCELTRSDCVIAAGGGAMGDTVNFACSVYMRGIACVMIPTTLTAMADSCIGGKCAVDLPEAKNLIGTFHDPALVLIDIGMLETLDKREINSGMAEVIKCACIADEELFSMISRKSADMEELVFRSLCVKRAYIEADPFDRGERHMLNFGHTFGHAAERASDYRLLHGEAVAIGMAHMAYLGERIGITEPGTAERLTDVLCSYGLPTEYDDRDIKALIALDKKRAGAKIDAVLLERIGKGVRFSLGIGEI